MRFLTSSIRTKIIFPYILLTLLVGMVGTYIVTSLVFDSVEERLDNQLVTAARVGSDAIVDQENDRLMVLRQVSRTSGFPEALNRKNFGEIQAIILPILANTPQIDSVIILDENASEVFRIDRTLGGDHTLGEPTVNSKADFSAWPAVERVLSGNFDEFGDKFAILAQDEAGKTLVYTVGPVWLGNKIIGAALTGNYLENILDNLKLNVQTDVTFYDASGIPLYTTFPNQKGFTNKALEIDEDLYNAVLSADKNVPKQQANINGQDYQLLFAPFKLRGDDIGVISVGLPSDFVVKTSSTSRNLFSIMVFFAITILLGVGLIVTRQILKPIGQLVAATGAIAAGDLNRRTGVASGDEIGRLAHSFDQMTAELKQRTEDLEEETSKMRAILRSIADGVLVQGKDGQIIEHNPAADQILADYQNGLPPAETPPDDIASDQSQLEAALKLLNEVNFEEPKRFTIGERSVSALAAPVKTADQQTLGSVYVLRDITLEVESEQLKNKFIESVSHELLTPLVPIKGYMDLLVMVSAGKLDDKQEEFIAKIRDNLDDLHKLISTLIDVTQIEAGGLGLDKDEFEFDDLVEEVVETWKPVMVERQIAFKAHLTKTGLSLFGDANRLQRVFNELLDNASTYNHPGGKVDLHVKVEDEQIRVDITDNGVGIAPEAHKFIFTRFMRALNEDFYEVRGAGLGLYLSRSIVDQHGGKIWFETEVNKGSTFCFTLPVSNAK